MEEAPPKDGTFQLVPSSTPGVFDFKVAVHYGTPSPTSAVAAGTAYSAITAEQMNIRPYIGCGFDSYVAAQSEPAGTRIFWQHFVASLPTTPTISEARIDPIFGKVYDHTYLDLITTTKPDRADDFSTSSTTINRTFTGGTRTYTGGTRTLGSTRKVLDVTEDDMGQGLCKVVVTTAANEFVVIDDSTLDEDTGQLNVDIKTHRLTATKPTPAATGSDGRYTEVIRQRHNHWLSHTGIASLLPQSRAAATTWETTGRIYWPAVLQNYEWKVIVATSLDRLTKLLSYNMRDPYSGDVKLTIRRWWQKTPLTITPNTNMIASAIRINGNLQSVSIPECLHSDFVYQEQNWSTYERDADEVAGVFLAVVTFTFSATSQTEWPMTITKTEQQQSRGGFEVREETYHRPTEFETSTLTISERGSSQSEGLYYA